MGREKRFRGGQDIKIKIWDRNLGGKAAINLSKILYRDDLGSHPFLNDIRGDSDTKHFKTVSYLMAEPGPMLLLNRQTFRISRQIRQGVLTKHRNSFKHNTMFAAQTQLKTGSECP